VEYTSCERHRFVNNRSRALLRARRKAANKKKTEEKNATSDLSGSEDSSDDEKEAPIAKRKCAVIGCTEDAAGTYKKGGITKERRQCEFHRAETLKHQELWKADKEAEKKKQQQQKKRPAETDSGTVLLDALVSASSAALATTAAPAEEPRSAKRVRFEGEFTDNKNKEPEKDTN